MLADAGKDRSIPLIGKGFSHAAVPLLTNTAQMLLQINYATIHWPTTGCEMPLFSTFSNVHICHYTRWVGGSLH